MFSTTGLGSAWVRPRPPAAGLRADIGIAVVLAIASPLLALLYMRTGVYGENATYAQPWVWAVGIGLSTLPLAARRRYPVPVMVLVAIGFFVCGQFGVPDALIVQICMFLALYTVGAWEQNRSLALWARLGITLLMLIWVVINLIVTSSDADLFPGLPRTGIFSAFATFAAIQIITNLLYFGAAFLFGERSWRAARTQALLEAQGRELALERQTSAAQAVALDRLGIARELHDVVAHHVSVMGIQAGAAQRLLAREPERAAASLEVIEQSAQAAIEELRRLVRTLRTPEAEASSTTIGISQLPALVAESQNAGVPTTLIVAGEPRPLPMLVDVALYRAVQEALTNVRKHAGRGTSAEVRLRFGPESVEVEIADDGVRRRLAEPSTGSGLGLRGMRERIGAVGGQVYAGRRERDGFIVRAAVPHVAIPGDGSAAGEGSGPHLGSSAGEASGPPAGPRSGEGSSPGGTAIPGIERVDA
ncbi:sensor histidine kinase [Leucobacter ruminantium]|uniref:histidine kinase n=1 Tax=Leucobacter ruminantium TaxID=1289170 RepID=A0A939RY70_9MICO|nr:sensor histidine kinase [Leucobacter ruminantium]MBO1805403.1 sensor histidine kinase [Leucobacter ruminantium]